MAIKNSRLKYRRYTDNELRRCLFHYLSGKLSAEEARQLGEGNGEIPRTTVSQHANFVARMLMPLYPMVETESTAAHSQLLRNILPDDLRREMKKHPNYKRTNLNESILKQQLDDLRLVTGNPHVMKQKTRKAKELISKETVEAHDDASIYSDYALMAYFGMLPVIAARLKAKRQCLHGPAPEKVSLDLGTLKACKKLEDIPCEDPNKATI